VPQPSAHAGPIALHGGGEFLPGDEPFLDALLDLAGSVARSRATNGSSRDLIRILILPTAAARGRPDETAAMAIGAFARRGEVLGKAIRAETARIVDAASAQDAAFTGPLASADLIYLPGGDPDIAPRLLNGTAAGRSLARAHRDGTVLAGASAGAMALAEWSWTPQGGIPALGLVRGLVVVPHYDEVRRMAWQSSLDKVAPAGFGYLGLDERTGVISDGAGWRVAGAGAAHWFEPGSSAATVARHGERLDLQGSVSPSPAALRRCR
jgi:cyanophycinase-like exopeptidase